MDKLSVVIQAGGASRRMGQDKACMPFLGKPLLEHITEKLALIADEMLAIVQRSVVYPFLNIPAYPDLLLGRGPLGGLYSALSYAQFPLVGIVACDMPFANPALLAYQRELLISSSADVVIPVVGQGLEPFHAIYRRETCLPLVLESLQEGEMRLVAWLKLANVRYMTEDEMNTFDPDRRAFSNLNTPEEFAEAELIAGTTTCRGTDLSNTTRYNPSATLCLNQAKLSLSRQ